MELDNFKELWDKDVEDLPEVSLEKQNEIHSPLEMIRNNMKTEFWLLIITLPTILYGFPFRTHDTNIKIISIIEVILTLGFMTYFYSRFIKLYKLLNRRSINTNYDLFNLKTQLLISKETYISYYISYIPLALLICLIQVGFHFDAEYNIIIFAICFLMSILIICFMIKYWIHYMYGKYIDEVVRVVDELNGVEVKDIITKEKTWFEKTQVFFITKYGIKGNSVNTVIWFVFSYVVIILFFTIILLMIIFISVKLNFIDLRTLIKALNKLN